jgi:PelA/Pel-15E family pectate lyase
MTRMHHVALPLVLAIIAGSPACATGPIGAIPLVGAADTAAYVDSARVARLPVNQRVLWQRYLARSAELQRADRALIDVELRDHGRARMVPAPDVRESFTVASSMVGNWFRTEAGRRFAASILSFQTPSGGWSKHVDYSAGPRAPGMSFFSENDSWSFIATIDNNATTEQIRFLARAYDETSEEQYRASLLRAFDYLLAAQYPNGCWPQVYPLMGGYHDAATFNDDATANVLKILRDIARGRLARPAVSDELRARAARTMQRGIDCLLAAQVVVGGRRTIWGQQQDPLTLAPVGARSYEHAALAGESAGIAEFLMDVPNPSAGVVDAVHAAVDWFKAHAVHGVAYDPDKGIVEAPGAGPVWSRMSEIGTNRPIFSNRDGVILYDYRKLTDRATGYAWFTGEPAAVLAEYERWALRHPRVKP